MSTRLPRFLRRWWPELKSLYTVSTRLVAPASMVVARHTRHGGPQGVRRVTGVAYDDRSLVEVLKPAQPLVRSLPAGDPERHPSFLRARNAHSAALVLGILPDSRVDGRTGAVIDRSNFLIDEFSPYFGIRRPTEHPLFLRPLRHKPDRFPGTLGVLATRGDANYYHFLTDVLPRFGVLEEDAVGKLPGDRPDAYYVPSSTAFQRELLGMVDLPSARVLDSRQYPHVLADRVKVVSVPAPDHQLPLWVVAWIRERLLPYRQHLSPRNLYITRGVSRQSRSLLNEGEIVGALSRYGFEVIDPGSLSVQDQISLFASARTIVGPHGAALANIVFCSPGAQVIELFAPDYVFPCYWYLASQLQQLSYRYVVGSNRRQNRTRGITSDFLVEPERLLTLLP